MYESVEITKCKVPTLRYCSQKYIHYLFYIDALNLQDIETDLLFSKFLVKESKDRLFFKVKRKPTEVSRIWALVTLLCIWTNTSLLTAILQYKIS